MDNHFGSLRPFCSTETSQAVDTNYITDYASSVYPNHNVDTIHTTNDASSAYPNRVVDTNYNTNDTSPVYPDNIVDTNYNTNDTSSVYPNHIVDTNFATNDVPSAYANHILDSNFPALSGFEDASSFHDSDYHPITAHLGYNSYTGEHMVAGVHAGHINDSGRTKFHSILPTHLNRAISTAEYNPDANFALLYAPTLYALPQSAA